MKFIHTADCHLGGWRQKELSELNFKSFQFVISRALKEKVDFFLVAGDLFDSAYPPIEILKETFYEFRKLKEAGIPVFIIAGSHDYSVSGKTFLDVMEKAGLCTNVFIPEERDGKIMLQPTIFKGAAIYGYPGKKSSLEVEEIEKITLQDAPGLFRILMLHTALSDAVPKNIGIKCINAEILPKVDYVALGHLHVKYNKNGRVYSGPSFPNNISELEELKNGSFVLFDNGRITREEIQLKEVLSIELEISKTSNATENILSYIKTLDLKNKIVILKLKGVMENGKTSDIDFDKIESFAKSNGAFSFLKSTSSLLISRPEFVIDSIHTKGLEESIISGFQESNPSKFNHLISPLMRSLHLEKLEDEKSAVFWERLVSETKKVLNI